jgi:hypothetical protein
MTIPGIAAGPLRLEKNAHGSDLTLALVEMPSEEINRVIKSIRMKIVDVETGNEVIDLTFDPPVLRGTIMYNVQNGKVVQGAPALGFAAAPVLDVSQAAQQLSLFAYNGNDWLKTTSLVNTADNTVSFTSGRAGYFQIRLASRAPGLTLTRVYPRIITPNGDGWNDKAVFQFDNPELLPLSGKIYDITGATVATLKPGPTNPDSTLIWDGKDGSGRVVPSGIYLYEVDVNGKATTGTVVVAR